ncbi:ammonium transporter 1 member 3-like [Polistes fuscatus]|uniref:ammonium transporter 1 member 3-like n=1 Tax=Polistes fuscatus TaxID=30207 RepID=UPI001CA93315|nr:ammonium transporter 1 member 3-like [Polistes fuscatus]
MYPNNPNPSNETFSNPLLKVNEFYRYVYFSNYTTRIILTILSRIGYVLLQISSVSKQDNLNLILFKNIKDICCTTIAYFTIGFLVIFDADVYSFIYGDYYSFENFLIKKEEFLIGWQVVIMTSAIYMISMTENICFIAHFLVNLLLAGLVQPFLIRWSLMPEGWIVKGKLYDVRVYFRDHAGSGIVHVVGGLSGLIIYLILSRKNYIFKAKNIDRINLPSFLLSTTCLGLFLIFVGLLNLSLSTSENDTSNNINTVINNLIAACCCSLCFMILHLTFKRSIDHWTTLRCVQGLIVGLIMISSASNKYSHLMSIGLGYLGGVIFYLISRLIFYRDLDHCNIIAIHLICGFFANVLAPFCVSEQNASTQFRLLNLSWQLISLIVLMGLVTVTLTPLLLILQVFGFLKHRSQIFKVNESTISLEMTKRFSDKNITCDKYEESIINNTNLLSIKFTGENSYQPQNELSRLEEDEFIKENYLNKIATMKNEELSDPSQSSGLHHREEKCTN